jgi:long-chain acyl-CoA synthetase
MLTLTSLLHRTVRLYGDHPAVIDPEARFSWTAFADRVARAASVLQSLGVQRGERYGIIARNGFRHAELIYAGYWMGAVPVPVNYRLAPVEIAYVLDNAECRLLVVEDVFTALLDSAELAPWADAVLLVTPFETQSAWPKYEPLLTAAAPAPAHDSVEDDDALIVYTGGTTGRPKGVRLSHRNIVSNGLQVGFECPARADDVYLHVAPMFHSADLLATAYTMAGAAHAFLPKFSGQALLEAIQAHRVTSTMLTPTMAILAIREPDLDRIDLSSLRQVLYGSSPMAVEWIGQLLERLPGVEIVQGYGLTETSPILTILHMTEHERAIATGEYDILKSAGRPIPGVDMRIVDVNDRELPIGQPGEVTVRAPNVSMGYLKRREATEAAFHDGWFYTGDIGRLDERGYLYLLDRKKDMIITGGENVFSLEIETVLHQNPKVHECAVIGVPDETWGEALLAVVVPKPGETLTDEEMITHCRGKIGGYKIPRRYEFLEALPKSAMDKILKTELRRRYGGAAQDRS